MTDQELNTRPADQAPDHAEPYQAQTELFGRRFAAVLFDLDGTLIDSTAAVVRSWLAWAAERGIDPARLQGYHGVPSIQIVRDLVPTDEVDAACARINEMELLDVRGIAPSPGAVEALAALPPGRAAIVTSCTGPLAAARIGAVHLDPPAVVVTADDVARGKPDPQAYLLGASRLGVDVASCLVVEDAPSGLAAARAAGMTTLAVTTTTAAEQLTADIVVQTLADVRFRMAADGVAVVAQASAPWTNTRAVNTAR